MGSSDGHDYLTTDDPHHLRRYIVRAAKAYLCAACWFGLWAVLLMYGPPALSVPSRPTHADGAVAAIVGMVLSGGVATVLTIVLAVVVVAGTDWIRHRSVGEQEGTDGTDVADSVEEDTHA
jgi:hypothetical protein